MNQAWSFLPLNLRDRWHSEPTLDRIPILPTSGRKLCHPQILQVALSSQVEQVLEDVIQELKGCNILLGRVGRWWWAYREARLAHFLATIPRLLSTCCVIKLQVARANGQVPSKSGVASQLQEHPIEKPRTYITKDFIPPLGILMEDLNNNHNQPFYFPVTNTNGLGARMANLMATPGDSGDDLRSIPSSGSGHGFPSQNFAVDSGRTKPIYAECIIVYYLNWRFCMSRKKTPFSSSKLSGGSLEPDEEENP